MLTSFTVNNFRCFSDFTISPLERINLIAGMNNVGKTALLEGLFLFSGATNPTLAMNIGAFRGIGAVEIKPGLQSETPWNTLFRNLDENSVITLSGINGRDNLKRSLTIRITRKEAELVMKPSPEKGKEGFLITESSGRILEFEYTDEAGKSSKSKLTLDAAGIRVDALPIPGPYFGIFLASRQLINPAEDSQRYSNLEKVNKQGDLLEILKIVEPKLRRLAVLVTAGMPMIYGDIGLHQLLPLAIMGDGLARICSLVLAIANTPDGIVFIDEIENGIHYSILDKIWDGIAEAARRYNTQIFATTHSRECILAAHSSFSQSRIYDFHLHRLDKVNEKITVKTYDRKTLDAAATTGLEVR